jgi:uncharacterized membrane protein YqjE
VTAEAKPPAGGLRDAFARIAADTLALVHTRLELASIELTEETERVKTAIVLVAVAALFAAFALMTATLLVIVLFWDTHREGAILGVTLFYAVLAVLALWRASVLRREAPRLLSATLAELDKDRERFSRSLR